MPRLGTHLEAADKASLFDAFERAATQVGLALFVVHVDAAPPVVLYASQALAELVGRPTTAIVGKPPWELVAPSERQRVREVMASRGPGAPPMMMEFAVERPGGAQRDMEVGVSRITTPGAELAVCYFRDMTQERQALAALRRSEERFRSLIENAADGVVIVQDGKFALANRAAVRMFAGPNGPSLVGRSLSEFLPPSEAARAAGRIAELHAGSEPKTAEYGPTLDGRYIEVHSVYYEHEDRPAVLTFIRDATERRGLQEQVIRNDRLAALGTMAAAVAHEINNPLTYLQLSLQRLEREMASEPNPERAAMLREQIGNALHGTARVARIVRDLRAYSRNDVNEPESPVDVISIVERALQMVEHDLRHRARLVRRYPREPAIVDAVAGRLEQVMMNLLVNAIQALDGNDPAKHLVAVEVDVGTHVTITVSDSGHGVVEIERVFEPFSTTKRVGEGTGLGLSVCKQLVESMRGQITVESEPDVETKVTIVLPLHAAPVAAPATPAPQLPRARLRILVIDDEQPVRVAVSEGLALEHDVQGASDGEGAIAMIRDRDYDVIVCDLMMPRMNGREVYDRVREMKPGLERRIVFMTGGAFLPWLATFLDSVDNLKLRKPFSLDDALATVHVASLVPR